MLGTLHKGSVNFTGIRLPYFDFQTSVTVSGYRAMLIALEEVENGCQRLKIKVGEPDTVPVKSFSHCTVGEPKAWFGYGSLII